MKQELTNLARGSISRWLLTLAMMIVSMATWGASFTPVDLTSWDGSTSYTSTEARQYMKIKAAKTGVISFDATKNCVLYNVTENADGTITPGKSAKSPDLYKDDSGTQHSILKFDVTEGEIYYVMAMNKGIVVTYTIADNAFTDMTEGTEYTTPAAKDQHFYKITAAKAGTLTVTNTNSLFYVYSDATATSMGTQTGKGTANSDKTAYTYTAEVKKGDVVYICTIKPDQKLSYTITEPEPTTPESGSQIEFDTDYLLAFGDNLYYIIPSESGKVIVKGNDGGSLPNIYTDESHTTLVTSELTYITDGAQRVFTATAGTKYYLYSYNLNSSKMTFRVEMFNGLTLESVSPAAGSVFDITGTGQMSVKFNTSVSMSDATLTYGTTNKTLTRLNSGASILFDLKSIVGDLLQNGGAKAGDKFTVTIKGICEADDKTKLYGDDGTYTVEYILPEMPMMITDSIHPNPFLSYWAKGDDAGKLILTFSEDVYSGDNTEYCATADLRYGDLDKDAEGEYYYETVPVTVSGNTITLDFTDKIRTPQTMLPDQQSNTFYETINVKVSNIRNADGVLCYTGKSSTTGSFTFSMKYQLSEEYEVEWEFTPASGESIAEVDNIELYIAGDEALRYDGFTFAYEEDGETKTIELALDDEDNVTKDTEDDGVVYTIVIPAAAKTGENVKLFPTNLVCVDGIDRNILAIYNLGVEKVTIGETGYSTLYYSDVCLTVPDGVDAWTYSASGSTLTATESYPAGEIIPAGEAVVLRTHEPSTYEFAVVIPETEISKVADNALKGTDEAVEVYAGTGNLLYILGVGSEGIGFYQASEDGASFINKAHKAYLEVSADADAKFFSLDGTATGINGISNNAESNQNIYNLQGQKLQNMNRSGLYIVGGKKVVVK